jgi:hypothetical protein
MVVVEAAAVEVLAYASSMSPVWLGVLIRDHKEK